MVDAVFHITGKRPVIQSTADRNPSFINLTKRRLDNILFNLERPELSGEKLNQVISKQK